MAAKPFSLVYRSADGAVYVKVYRGIEPGARRDREVDGLRLATQLGISAPVLYRTGEGDTGPWIEVGAVPGRPCQIGTPHALTHYLDQVLLMTGLLHLPVEPTDVRCHRSLLLGQLSFRCTELGWWSILHAALADVNDVQRVHLHGDLKPDHLFVQGKRLSAIDWESSTAGPAVQDFADAVFHLIRDLLYAGSPPDCLPVPAIGRLPVTGSVLAWRLALWLDRRRPTDITRLTVGDLEDLADTTTPDAAVRACATVVARLLADGVPR
ncbi:phosphotransferase [Streptomyces sp. NPDC001340]